MERNNNNGPIHHQNPTTLTSSNIINANKTNSQEMTHANNNNNPINTLAYPREVTIASTPIKSSKNSSLKSKTGPPLLIPSRTPLSTSATTSSSSASSVFTNTSFIDSRNSLSRQSKSKSLHKSKIEHFDSVNGGYENKAFDTQYQMYDTTMTSENESSLIDNGNFTIISSNDSSSMANLMGKKSGKINLRRESSQLLPQSIVSQMAKNFQSLTYFSSQPNGNYANKQKPNNINNNNNSQVVNQQSSTSNVEQQQLKDEDAWLPILNLVEEQVI